jgi:hypothetical protein
MRVCDAFLVPIILKRAQNWSEGLAWAASSLVGRVESGVGIQFPEFPPSPLNIWEYPSAPNPTIEGMRRNKMKWGFWGELVLLGCLAAGAGLFAQSPSSENGSGSGQNKPASDAQKPAAAPAQSGTNPFPEDINSVPVMPSKAGSVPGDPSFSEPDNGRVPLPGEDFDPVRSPDDPAPAAGSGQDADSSSSLKGIDSVLPPPDSDQGDKHRKLAVKEPTHQEAAATDIDVGKYYLETRNWKAGLSRFQSAMVLDPENPEVYWGLAETERHLDDFANARAHYQKLLEYDPDGPHGKQARKALKDPALANAPSVSTSQPSPAAPQ